MWKENSITFQLSPAPLIAGRAAEAPDGHPRPPPVPLRALQRRLRLQGQHPGMLRILLHLHIKTSLLLE